MAGARSHRGFRGEDADHWPGFVDALATLLLVVIFLLSLFAVAQYALGQALSGRDAQLARLNSQLAELADKLALETARAEDMTGQLTLLRASLEASQANAVALRGELDAAEQTNIALQTNLASAIENEAAASSQASDLELQIAALNEQLLALNQALEASEARDLEQKAQIDNLSERLNTALASKVAQLAQYRSRFFEELTTALGDRTDIRVVGDRFVFETDVLFDSGSADLAIEGQAELAKIAQVIQDVATGIPDDVDWIIRVDGHTDRVPIRERFASNWHLSTERAISVVNFFEDRGVPSKRLVAAGFGEHHPIDARQTPVGLARNRRIELKLDSR